MSTVPRALALSALLTLVPVGIGVAVSEDRTPTREVAAYEGTDLADFDTTAAVVQRAPFCELVPAQAVSAALGVEAEPTAYGNGEESEALPSGDVAHEYGCLFNAGPTVGNARAWVFAPPVTTARAEQLVTASQIEGCTTETGAPAYGAPSLALTCATGDLVTVSYRGLFGDAWLACSLTLPAAEAGQDAAARAGRWCVAVAEAASVLPS
ncbi:hypothetical protein ASE01_09665 [Nocardioides sp. Root190]|uniref:hypothetical protein n=1 Tax=Nocardioides sp. Root190 TaxID=1736488 RepID=UPI000713155A|nr:hypothetical protein [Nocardioides sp. Root190]KRB77021.1 hypothetical protein ASE01_09665 [Nocardioides sp. Root190]